MTVNQKTGRIEPIDSLNEVHRFLPELQREVSLKFFSLNNVGSSEITPEHWTEIALTIESIYDDFDGFVVIHGTNTMSYTAAALSFALQGLSKPVVLTGAIMPLNELTGDGRMNLIYAIRAAQLDIAEVCVVLGPRILRGSRAKKVDQSLLRTFDTLTCPRLGDFHLNVKLSQERFVRRKRTLKCRPTFDSNISIITLFPGLPESQLQAILDAAPHGIVLRTYGPGMLPESLFDWIRDASKQNIPILITSQALRGKVNLHRYRKQLVLERLGVMSAGNMSYECGVVKLMWALTQTNNMQKLHALMEKSLVGELDEEE